MLQNFQSIQQTIQFSMVPLNKVKQNNPIANAFIMRKVKKPLALNIYQSRKNKHGKIKDSISYEDGAKNEFQYSNVQKEQSKQNQLLQGLLKTRKSEIKKFKLKEFYLSSQATIEQAQYQHYQQVKQKEKMLKSRSLLNTLQPKGLQDPQNLISNINRKKVLPVKLRAKSYLNIPKNKQKHTLTQFGTKNESILKSSENLVEKKYQQYLGFYCHKKQIKDIKRRKVDSRNLKDITNVHNNTQNGNESISQKINKTCMNECIENTTKACTQRMNRRQPICKRDRFSKKDCFFQLNPWNQNQKEEDKQNDFSFFF